MHVGLFAGFGGLWLHALRGPLRRRAGRVAALGVLFAALTELGQGVLPFERTASLLDGLADAAGLLLGIALAYGSTRFRSPQAHPPGPSAP